MNIIQNIKLLITSDGRPKAGWLKVCDNKCSAVRIVFFHFKSNRIVIVGLKSHQ